MIVSCAGPCHSERVNLHLGARRFELGEFAVMAIVNRTPDSFYDGGANVRLKVQWLPATSAAATTASPR